MINSNKLYELKKISNAIQSRINDLSNHTYNYDENMDEPFYFLPHVKYENNNDDTSIRIIKLKKGMISKTISEETFNRIICTSGKIKIHFISFKETSILTSPNTQLILPYTKYIIQVLEDSEIINLYKKIKKGKNFKIMEQETIYNKKDIYHE